MDFSHFYILLTLYRVWHRDRSHLKQNVVVTTFYNFYYFSQDYFLWLCSYYVDFPSVAAVEAALVIMQCTTADLKDVTADDGWVGYAVKYVMITGVISLIDSMSIIVDDEWCEGILHVQKMRQP